MDGQWRWEQVFHVHFTWVNPQLCQTNAANTTKLRQDARSQSSRVLAETRPRAHGWAIQLAGGGGQEDPNSSSQHQSVYTQREFSEVSKEDQTANYCHCVPTGGHPCLPANRIVFRQFSISLMLIPDLFKKEKKKRKENVTLICNIKPQLFSRLLKSFSHCSSSSLSQQDT